MKVLASMLSQKARYALRAMIELARAETQVTAGEREGLVISRRGKFGGYVLARDADAISFAEIIRLVDGPLALTPCVSRTAFRRCEDCRDIATCALREALLRARDATAGVLEGYSLADAAKGAGAELIER